MQRIKHAIVTLPVIALCLSGCGGGTDASTPTTSKSGSQVASHGSPGRSGENAAEIWSKAEQRLGSYTWLAIRIDNRGDNGNPWGEARGATRSDEPSQASTGRAGFNLEVRFLGGSAYITGDRSLWALITEDNGSISMDESLLKRVTPNKWIKASPEALGRAKTELTTKGTVDVIMKDARESPLHSARSLVTHDQVNGRSAYKLETVDHTVKAWVSDDGNYDLLKMEDLRSRSSTGTTRVFTFSEWNKPKAIAVPAGAIERHG